MATTVVATIWLAKGFASNPEPYSIVKKNPIGFAPQGLDKRK